MRLIEAVLLLTDAVVLLALSASTYPLTLFLRGMATVPIAVVTVLVGFAGVRWQISPAILVAVCILAVWSWYRPAYWLVAGVGLVLAGTATLCIVLPVFRLPRPSGPYTIGVSTRHLKDRCRADPRAGRPGVGRELVVEIWYPADQSGVPAPYRASRDTTFRTRHFTLVATHASEGVPVSKRAGRLPVILYCSSWMGRRGLNTVQVEDLASRGFLVVTIDHPYGSADVAFPDGRIARSQLGGFLSGETVDAVESSRREANAELETWTADVGFVLDELQRLDLSDSQGLLAGRVDLGRVGIFGYSFGGAVACEASRKDPRIKAVVNYDGMLFGDAAELGVECPFLYVSYDLPTANDLDHTLPLPLPGTTGEEWRSLLIAHDVKNVTRSLLRHGGDVLLIPEADHSLFSDASLFTPLHRHHLAARVQRVLTDITSAFFERYLLTGAPVIIGHDAAKDPIAVLKRWPPPGMELGRD